MTRSRGNRSGKKSGQKGSKDEEIRAESPFFGFSNSDIPQPILIKTEPVEDGDSEDCEVVEVTKASNPLPTMMIKKENEDSDDLDTFHGFSTGDLPKPIVIKEEPSENGVSAERSSTIPEDDLLDEFESQDSENNVTVLNSKSLSPETAMNISVASSTIALSSPHVQSTQTIRSPPGPPSTLGPKIPHPKFVTRPSTKNDLRPEPVHRINTISKENLSLQQAHAQSSLPQKIQIIDENGEKIELITQEAEVDFDTGDETEEDHEFTVVVEENDEGEVTTITKDVRDEDKKVIEADSIEDIIAQFEHNESANGPRSVSCPNCRKCFVSNHFLNLHISNTTTMCELCNTQCCSQVNLRNHKNLECDLAKRKRNIDLIAKETALLGRKPIEPENYYNLPVEDLSEDEEEDRDMEDGEEYSPSPPKKHKLEMVSKKLEDFSDEVRTHTSHLTFVLKIILFTSACETGLWNGWM